MEKQGKVFYREHILLIPTRNISNMHRHFILDLHSILPHSKKCDKMEYDQIKRKLPELCEQQKCQIFMIFQTVGDQLVMQIGKYPIGPTIKFSILNLHLMKDLHLAGNFSKKGQCLLSFDQLFGKYQKYRLCQELLTSAFTIGEARFTDKFIDRMIGFYCEGEIENRIWVRHFEILNGDLREIGPRFVMELVDIQDGMFGGQFLYQGTNVVGEVKQKLKKRKSEKKFERLIAELNNVEKEEFVE